MIFLCYSISIGYVMPVLLIGTSYYCILRKLRTAATGSAALISSKRARERETTNKRIEKLVVAIICTYTFCWLPYWIVQIQVIFLDQDQLRTAEDDERVAFLTAFSTIAAIFSYLNSALNPILYAFLSDKFKSRCEEVYASVCAFLCRCCACCSCCVRCQPDPLRLARRDFDSRPPTNVSVAVPTDALNPKVSAGAPANCSLELDDRQQGDIGASAPARVASERVNGAAREHKQVAVEQTHV